jgi:hypothetical protein
VGCAEDLFTCAVAVRLFSFQMTDIEVYVLQKAFPLNTTKSKIEFDSQSWSLHCQLKQKDLGLFITLWRLCRMIVWIRGKDAFQCLRRFCLSFDRQRSHFFIPIGKFLLILILLINRDISCGCCVVGRLLLTTTINATIVAIIAIITTINCYMQLWW